MRIILRFSFFSIFFVGCIAANGQYPWMIYTYAGCNTSGDYIPATSSFLNGPRGLTFDGVGNLYIADLLNNRVRKIDSLGTITTVAGVVAGGSTTGTLATQTYIDIPADVAFDASGNLYIAGNNSIYKVSKATGVVSIFAGTYSMYTSFSGDGGPATAAVFYQPSSIAFDSAGNMYIADVGNKRIRKIDVSGIITTVAGNGSGDYNGDNKTGTSTAITVSSLAVDKAGNVLFTDGGNIRLRKLNTSTGIVTTIAGNGHIAFSGDGGQAIAAQFSYPSLVKLDADGNIYVNDDGNNRIRKINTAGFITTIAGNGTLGSGGDGGLATAAQLGTNRGLAIDSAGNIFLSDYYTDRIRKIDKSGIIKTIAGNGTSSYYVGEGQFANLSQFNRPNSIAFDSKGNMYIADIYNERIRKIDPSGIITSFAGTGYIYGGYTGDGGPATLAQLYNPTAVAVDAQDNVYIVDAQNNVIRKVNTLGIISTVAGSGVAGYSGDGGKAILAKFNAPTAVAVDKIGNIYVTEYNNNCVRKIDTSGIITTIAGNGTAGLKGDKGLATAAQLNVPSGIFVDTANNIFIADLANRRVRKIDASGIINTVAGGGNTSPGDGGLAIAAQIVNPIGVTADKVGNFYFSDGSNLIRKVDKNGILTTIGGTTDDGTTNFGGDGGSITARQHLFDPMGIALDSIGNVYVADYFNFRIRKLCVSPSLNFGTAVDSQRVSTVADINSSIVFYEGCNEMASLVPSGTNPVLGHISVKVWVDSVQQGLTLKRHYQITPSENASTATAKITLYYTQAEFDSYNAVNSVKFPTGVTDVAGKGNFKIEKRSGVSIDGTGSPSSYNGTTIIIDPDDNDIKWNSIYNRWEVSFNVTGFSGFFAKAIAAVLPVSWLSVEAKLSNIQTAIINWKVQEQRTTNYEVQKSIDGVIFKTIGTVKSIGDGEHDYSFTENQPLNGKAIYRIKQNDIDGRIDFSEVVYLGTIGKTMIYPNPTTAATTLFASQELVGSQAYLFNVQGKLLKQIAVQQNVQSIDLSHFATGIYLLKLANGQTVKLVKE